MLCAPNHERSRRSATSLHVSAVPPLGPAELGRRDPEALESSQDGFINGWLRAIPLFLEGSAVLRSYDLLKIACVVSHL